MLDKLGLLHRFELIARHRSIRQAAEALRISQPALSRSVRQLEDMYGERLFERKARGVVPTAFGQSLLAVASRLTREWELVDAGLRRNTAMLEGTLRINAGPLWSSAIIPRISGPLLEQYPGLVLEITNYTGELLIDMLNSSKVDVALGGKPLLGLRNEEFHTDIFTHVQDRVLARADHPIHAAGTDDFEAVHAYPWIAYSPYPNLVGETLHAVVERTGKAPPVRLRTSSLMALMRLMQEGDFLCMLPDALVREITSPQLAPVPMNIGKAVYPSGASYRKSFKDYEPLKATIQLCRQLFADDNAPGAG